MVLKLLKSRYPAQTIFHDLYLKMNESQFSQIDLILATKVGLIVFEVKKYSGWIYGTGYQPKWTQVLAFGKEKYRFYNPVVQNKKHIQNLKKLLSPYQIPIFSVVVFYGDCVFKDLSFIPSGTFVVKSERILDVLKKIETENIPAPYTQQNKSKIVRVLKLAVQNGESREIQAKHKANIKEMLGMERILR
ncbi:nuclease-related domain-containing protein [Pararhodonellum marinum]|uniref:nuclease-related domain-containing protein n=1 Tax=Pararhodonellum marinum TaxID=2755358 RepID=UPI00188F78E8|nr:nuclease-related domain-containing protein [Pararhodonellum marinum]